MPTVTVNSACTLEAAAADCSAFAWIGSAVLEGGRRSDHSRSRRLNLLEEFERGDVVELDTIWTMQYAVDWIDMAS
jgi:hypothetical protein